MAALKNKRHFVGVLVAINQLAFPGLGTIMGGRKSGWMQAVLMVVGFILVMGYFLWFFICSARYLDGASWTESQYRAQYQAYAWAWKSGTALCALAWCWALGSSLSMLSSSQDAVAAAAESPAPAPTPPPLPLSAPNRDHPIRHGPSH